MERQVLVAYMSKPSSHLSQLTVNEHCVTFCCQFYTSHGLLDGLHLTVFILTCCGHCSVAADANIVVTLLSPPINCFHFIDPHTVKFMA